MKARLLGTSLLASLAACSAQHGGLQIKPVGEASVRPDDGSLAKAQILLSRGEYALAIDAYRKAVRYDPGNAAAYNGLAISYDGVGRFDLSRRYYELALARAPRESKYYRNLALSLKRQGKADEAKELLAQMDMATAAPAAASATAKPAPLTLAGIARDGLTRVADTISDAARPHLDRLSMGEVLLSTGSSEQPVRTARSITVAIPVVEVRRPAEDIPIVAELTARPVGPSITIELPEAVPVMQEEPAMELAGSESEPVAGKPAFLPAGGVQIAIAAEPAALLEIALRPAIEPEPGCGASTAGPAFESAATGDANLAVFLGDFASARLGQSGSIDLPLIYRASVNLPVPGIKTEAVSSCTVQLADSPADADGVFNRLWREMDGTA